MHSSRIFRFLPALLAVAALRAQPVSLGEQKQLFLDDALVRGARGLTWRMNPPRREGIVLTGDRDWDNGNVSAYGTVLDDGGRYRMWYSAAPASHPRVETVTARLCYAESADGVHWTKPNLGLYLFEGSRANNILMELSPESTNVMIDPKAPPAERYKIVARMHERSARWPSGTAPGPTGLYMVTSPDGLHWTLHPRAVLPFDPDTLNMALYNDQTGKYLAYVRTWNPERRVGVVETDDLMQPWPYRRGVPIPVPGMIEAPTAEIPDAFGRDGKDPDNLDFYTPSVVKYPGAANAFLMFTSPYLHFPEPPVGKMSNDGNLDIDLAVSRDGKRFHRVSREPYIGLGPEGSRESRTLYMFIGMLLRKGDALQYYVGYDFTHGEYPAFAEMRRRGAVFLARQRRDGFVSLDAGNAEGSFSTPAVTFRGRRLTLNVDASDAGRVQVEVEDERGQPRPGFAFADNDPVITNELAASVTWRGGRSDLGSLAGRPVILAFRLRSAKLYALQFTE